MELSAIHHIEPGKLHDFKADLFVTTLGCESRGTNIARILEQKECRKVALLESHIRQEHSFTANRHYFTDQEFEIIPVNADVPDVKFILGDIADGNPNIIFDCTSMSQRWYYEFFRWFNDNPDDFENVNLRFAYTMADYIDHTSSHKVKKIRDFLKVEDKIRKRKKKALILGLGHEEHVCESIYNLIKPDLLFLFYADPPADKQFVEKVFVNNHALINLTPIRNLIAYPIRNGQMIYQSLIDIILPLREEYSISLVPQGPKIFSVAAMLVHLGYPDTVISYPVLKTKQISDRKPSGEPVVLDVHFEGEE
jgi:hypothetical protein